MYDEFLRRPFLYPLPSDVPRLDYWPPTDTLTVSFEELIPGTCTPVREIGRRSVIFGEDPGQDGSYVWGYEFVQASKGCDLRGAHRADDIAREMTRWRFDVPVRRRAALAGAMATDHLGLIQAAACTAPEWALLAEGLSDAPRAEQRAFILRWLDNHEPSARDWREIAEWALRDSTPAGLKSADLPVG